MVKEVKLKVPGSMAVRYQILELASGSPMICMAAALGVCWSGHGAPGVRWKTGHAAEYGAAVLDWLMARKWTIERINAEGSEACGLISDSLPTDDDEKEALGNSEGPEDSESTS